MSDLMLLGVLRMPLELHLADDVFGPPQLQSRMLQAADELERRADRIAELERENEALRKDAERYLRLRDHTEYPSGEIRDDLYVHVDSVHAMNKWALSGADLDAFLDREIDAALKEQSKC